MLQALGKAEECVPFLYLSFVRPRELTRSAAQDRRERVRRRVARRGPRILGGRRRRGGRLGGAGAGRTALVVLSLFAYAYYSTIPACIHSFGL